MAKAEAERVRLDGLAKADAERHKGMQKLKLFV